MDRDAAAERHRQLTEEGWVRRFTAEEPRLSEARAFYESLGMEVRVEPGTPDEGQQCSDCFAAEGFQDRYRTIYTRGEACVGTGEHDDMFLV
jgi:hypothetical protein